MMNSKLTYVNLFWLVYYCVNSTFDIICANKTWIMYYNINYINFIAMSTDYIFCKSENYTYSESHH